MNEDITITVRHSPSLPTRKIPPPFFLFFIVLKKTNERGKKEERKKKSFNDRLAVGYPPPTVYNNSTSVCGPFQSHLSSGFYLEHHRAQLEVEMFHRVAIPQEADALHVEPVERYTKKKGKHQKKKKRKFNQQRDVTPSRKRHKKVSNKPTHSRRSKVQWSCHPYPVNNLYPTHYCLHTQCIIH